MYMWIWSLLFACSSQEETHEHGHHDDHEHGEEAIQNTIWTDHFEAFVEYPPLREGGASRFLIHMTWLAKHRPLTEGTVTLHLQNDYMDTVETVDAPARTGIFIPTLKPTQRGEYRLYFHVESEGVEEDIALGTVNVLGATEQAHSEGGEEPEIAMLKEQAWKMDFQTSPVMQKEMYSSVDAVGVWKYAPLSQSKIVAPTSGILSFGQNNILVGASFLSGDTLATIHSGSLTQDSLLVQWKQKKAEWQKVSLEYQRKEPLFQKGILSAAQWEEVEQRYQEVKAEYDALASGSRNGSVSISMPAEGKILDVFAEQGDFVSLGDELFTMVHSPPSLIEIELPQRYISAAQGLAELGYKVGDEWRQIPVESFLSSRQKHSNESVLLTIEVPAEPLALEGSLIDVRLLFGDAVPKTAVPFSSLLEEYGTYSLVQQVSGEGYRLQRVEIGQKDATHVEIVSGLEEGTWVVSKGAYLVKMMSLSGSVPAHGHAH